MASLSSRLPLTKGLHGAGDGDLQEWGELRHPPVKALTTLTSNQYNTQHVPKHDIPLLPTANLPEGSTALATVIPDI